MENNIKREINQIEIPEELSERSKLGVATAKLEMRKSKRKWTFILAPAIVAALSFGIFIPDYGTKNLPENPVIRTIEYSADFDLSDSQKLISWADNVFVGTVLKQDGTKSKDGIPETQFKVKVSDNIKGDFKGTVVVNQQGGYRGNELILMENDQLLQEGKSYLFVTKHLKEENWNTLVPVFGDIAIANGEEKAGLIAQYKTHVATADEEVHISTIELPKTTTNKMDMIALIVYNGKIYTQTSTVIEPEQAKDLLGESIGKTKGNINEWSTQDKYAVELASSIGKTDVFTVKGYDKDFRIMTYNENNGEVYTDFYERLNGLTIYDGKDVFGKLNLAGNLVNAKYRDFSDWDYAVENYYPIDDEGILNSFVEQLNHTVPYEAERVEDLLGDFRNDEEFKEMTLNLTDGSKVSLVILKEGYIHYGYSEIYFKMDSSVFTEMWEQLNNK